MYSSWFSHVCISIDCDHLTINFVKVATTIFKYVHQVKSFPEHVSLCIHGGKIALWEETDSRSFKESYQGMKIHAVTAMGCCATNHSKTNQSFVSSRNNVLGVLVSMLIALSFVLCCITVLTTAPHAIISRIALVKCYYHTPVGSPV